MARTGVLWIETDWIGSGHAIPTAWLEGLAVAASVGLLAVLVWLVLRGLLHSARYSTDVLDEAASAAIHKALSQAERRTVGEILPVVLGRSDAHPEGRWLAGLFVVLVGSGALSHWLPWDRPVLLLASQALFGALGYGLAMRLPAFHRAFVRESRATEMAEEQAFQEFYRNGLHRTEAATGVLVFVSLFERRVIVLADEGIDKVASEGLWQQVDEMLLQNVASGSLAAGLVEAVRMCGEALAEHHPWATGDRNEVPDRLVVRAE